ncbi:hypothetical protein SAMN06295905_0659 [Devosia lucknowensis]|uniref:META domain-containing protein n=1 Tax=Devosia lucknowensis TaxID=1096929 RepID=A0A1Y6EIG3_9HYPH|nr:hypothetical protein [Devosia lucknowensis]SMQ62384.1 hypothetical protein SAMN06295905_0659 [Devosia lucknowensis]
MPSTRIALVALLAMAVASPALAQDKTKPADAAAPAATAPAEGQAAPAAFNDLDADRINPNQITIDFEYTGGACEQVGPAEVGEVVDGTLFVTFPTISTAEVCTMQAVEIDVEQTIQAEHIVSLIDVTLTAPDGTVIAKGQTDVDQD